MDDLPHQKRYLSDFIRTNLEMILEEWAAFAQGLVNERHVPAQVLLDHAAGMLLTIADDIERPQTADQKTCKARGWAPRSDLETEAARHGAARVALGFTVSEVIAEFRALRESVLRLFNRSPPGDVEATFQQTTRFNEAIDQALAESLERYSLDKEEATRRFDTLLSNSPDLQFILDARASFIYANQPLAKLFGLLPENVVGKSIEALCPKLGAQVSDAIAQTAKLSSAFTTELKCHAEPDNIATYRVVFQPVFDEAGTVESVTGSARNISELKASEQTIFRQAYYDSLTCLPNRMLFRDRLDQETKHGARTGGRFAVLYVDLDGFKGVNDRYGHAEGDTVLQEAAHRLSMCVRASDTVARMGGDEFIIILSDLGRSTHVEMIAREIVTAIARPFHVHGKELWISCSIGITLYPDDAVIPDELVRNADQAMFVAKQAGRGQYVYFTPELRALACARQGIIDDLRRALQGGELAVYYQPIIDLHNDRIVKAEALLRWHHPDKGIVNPSEFIGIAEETGLIRDIGSAVLADAVVRVQSWSDLRGAPFPISVNKSPVEFMDLARLVPGDPDLGLFQAGGNLITVEITEGVMLNDSPLVRDKLTILRDAGVQLAIDDFGVGYSSMALLKRLKVDFLKIDRSFVSDVTTNDESRVLAETMVDMAHRLGMQVVAEGVETSDQHRWLKGIGCDFGQGFLFSEACDPDRFEKLLVAG